MMSLFVALENAGARRGQPLPIRRRSWVPGNRIQWNAKLSRWMFANVFTDYPLDSRKFLGCELGDLSCGCSESSQGCLTPESILADDWEVAP